jgi:hypothetical protein
MRRRAGPGRRPTSDERVTAAGPDSPLFANPFVERTELYQQVDGRYTIDPWGGSSRTLRVALGGGALFFALSLGFAGLLTFVVHRGSGKKGRAFHHAFQLITGSIVFGALATVVVVLIVVAVNRVRIERDTKRQILEAAHRPPHGHADAAAPTSSASDQTP